VADVTCCASVPREFCENERERVREDSDYYAFDVNILADFAIQSNMWRDSCNCTDTNEAYHAYKLVLSHM